VSSGPAGDSAADSRDARRGPWPGPWRGAGPELAIAGVTVAVTALAGGAVAGWPGVATVAIAAAALSMVVLRGLAPRSAAQAVRRAKDKQVARAIAGYGQRKFIVASSVSTRAFYESDLRPVLEHLLAARLAQNHGVNLYTDPAAAQQVFCRGRGDEALWRWVDPAQALSGPERDMQWHGIPRRTLARLVNRLEQL
jgi:hypothetical protein